MLVRTGLPKYESLMLIVAANNGSPCCNYTITKVKKSISKITCHNITLDDNLATNEKKLSVLRYEIRKGKYLDEKNTAFIVRFEPAAPYRELLQVIHICMQEQIKQYILLNDEFVIIPADPVPTPVQKEVKLLYL